ncbi:MAG TPA: tetratricopeptide repeat protein [Verrucomicrobiae bacterium]
MLPPARMLSIKNESGNSKPNGIMLKLRLLALIVLAAALAGCAPAGTHALVKGKKLLDAGDYADAADEFKSATEDVATNAEAWNYLGVAEQHTGQLDDAAKAYQRALELDRDLMEAHYNLGCLWMQEDKPDKAVSEFTAFTLRKVNEPDGWLKLGLAQLGTHDLLPAEKSFSTALYWNPNNAEALNGLGLARMERGRPEEGKKFFEAAVQNHPDFAPAILNLATVEHEYLHDDRQALHEYLAYLSLNPRPANSDDVNAIVNSIEQSPTTVAMASTPQTRPNPPMRQPVAPGMEPSESTYEPPKQQQKRRERRTETARANTDNGVSTGQSDTSQQPTENVQVQPETRIASAPASGGIRPASEPDVYRSIQPTPPSNQSSGGGFFHWLHSESSQTSPPVTPLPAENTYQAPAPVRMVRPAPPVYPRYNYMSPAKPASGDHRAATGMFARARDYETERRFPDALEYYRRAASLDPAWFEAQYNCGVMAYRLRDFQFSLAAYETALAIEPESTDARYNFALALKSAGFVTDAVNELRRILASNPNDARAHLELGNLYAQKLHDVPHARAEYLKVLQLDPGNPQAANIEFWLSANPQ